MYKEGGLDLTPREKDKKHEELSDAITRQSHVIGSTEALEFAQTKLSPYGKEGKYMEKLEVRCFFHNNLVIHICVCSCMF
jgi:hypothetical protein